jgi:hypothetical protein
MNKVPNIPWWSVDPQQAEPAPDTDYADMGTAFGLDASLKPKDEAQPPEPGEARSPNDRLNGRSVI